MTKEFLIIRVPKPIKERFANLCRARSQNMTSQLNHLIAEFIGENAKPSSSSRSGGPKHREFAFDDEDDRDQPLVFHSPSFDDDDCDQHWRGF